MRQVLIRRIARLGDVAAAYASQERTPLQRASGPDSPQRVVSVK
jgi:hypothetical protein